MFSDSPIMLSFPHFYLADPKLRAAVEGISEPDPEKHGFWLDVQPVSIHGTLIVLSFYKRNHNKLTI